MGTLIPKKMKIVPLKLPPIITYIVVLMLCVSCKVSKSFPLKYYTKNEATLQKIQKLYDTANKPNNIAIAFTNWGLTDISLELKTEAIHYIYEFNYKEKRLIDTLQKFGYKASTTVNLINEMQKIKCTWVNTLEYYVDGKKYNLLCIAIHAKRFIFNQKTKYYVLHFYKQPQYYNEQGKLLNKRKLKQLRKINAETFVRINDKVCYTISSKFR